MSEGVVVAVGSPIKFDFAKGNSEINGDESDDYFLLLATRITSLRRKSPSLAAYSCASLSDWRSECDERENYIGDCSEKFFDASITRKYANCEGISLRIFFLFSTSTCEIITNIVKYLRFLGVYRFS